ncbi:MAG: transporter substrate-binding domain-containing protein [Pseudomonadota bacterium]
MRLVPSALIVAALACPLAHAATSAPLRLCFEDAPQAPWSMPDGSGLNFDLLKRVEKLTGEHFLIVPRPWKRCIEETRNGVMDGIVSAADSPERRSFTLPPMLPSGAPDNAKAIYEDQAIVYLRVGSGAAWDGKTFINPGRGVLAQRGYLLVDVLRARGEQVLDSIKTGEEGLRILAAGGADVAVLLGRSAEEMARKDPRYRERVEMAKLPFFTFSFHLLINKKTYEGNPKRIEAIWNAIRTVRESADYRKLESVAQRNASG